MRNQENMNLIDSKNSIVDADAILHNLACIDEMNAFRQTINEWLMSDYLQEESKPHVERERIAGHYYGLMQLFNSVEAYQNFK